MAGLKESDHLTLPFKEIEVATRNFETCIGKGGYGRVYRGELLIAGTRTMLSQLGYTSIEEVPSDKQPTVIQPITVPAHQVAVFSAIEAKPTDKQLVHYFKRVQILLSFATIKNRPKSNFAAVPALQMGELKKITGNFHVSSKIGEGLFGSVYHGVLRSGQAAAIKMLNSSEQPDQDFLAQVSMASRLKHDNVIQMLGYCVDDGSKGHKGAQQTRPVLSWAERVKIAFGAAKGLVYLHETAHIVHRDIKSSNVLLFDDHVAKIADFDLSNQDPNMSGRTQSTRTFNFGSHAPDFGVVLLELLTGRKPVDRTLPRGQQSLVTWATSKFDEDKVKECIDTRLNGEYPRKEVAKMAAIATLCLQYEPEHRPDMRMVVKEMQLLMDPSSRPLAGASEVSRL
ncbi:hypothetical protein M8C21_026180, partial [Ambrosia artemisiifolia]